MREVIKVSELIKRVKEQEHVGKVRITYERIVRQEIKIKDYRWKK